MSYIYHLFRRLYRLIDETVRGFIADDCYSKALALTFYSLMAIVPLLAVLFGIAKGFGVDQALESEIREKFVEQREVTEKLIDFAHSWLRSAQGGVIAGVGIVVLLWSTIGLLGSIENALNSIWKVKEARTYGRRISDYLATLLLAPLFFVTASSINIYVTAQLKKGAESNLVVEVFSPIFLFVLQLFPFFLTWALFVLLYVLMPSTKVNFRTAVIAGIIAGTAFQIWQWVYIKFQVGAASYGAIYGSFAALPLFLLWLQMSWLTVLAGAELAVTLATGNYASEIAQRFISAKAAALYITKRCSEAFTRGTRPLMHKDIAAELGISFTQANELLTALQTAKILSEVVVDGRTFGYQPGKPPETIMMKEVCDAVDASHAILAQKDPGMRRIEEYLTEVDTLLADPKNNRFLCSVE